MADHDAPGDAEFAQQRPEPEPQRLDAHKIDFALEQPARVVFAKARGLDQRAATRRRRCWEGDPSAELETKAPRFMNWPAPDGGGHA